MPTGHAGAASCPGPTEGLAALRRWLVAMVRQTEGPVIAWRLALVARAAGWPYHAVHSALSALDRAGQVRRVAVGVYAKRGGALRLIRSRV